MLRKNDLSKGNTTKRCFIIPKCKENSGHDCGLSLLEMSTLEIFKDKITLTDVDILKFGRKRRRRTTTTTTTTKTTTTTTTTTTATIMVDK